MRAMMDGLMGASRDMTEDQKVKTRKSYDDPSLDKYHLCGCSPYELLSETKCERMCPPDGWGKQQDTGLQRDFLALSQEERDGYGFEYDLQQLLRSLIGSLEKQIESEKMKIKAEEQLPPEFAAQVAELDQKISELQNAAMEAGENGDVDQANQCHEEAQQLVAQKQSIEVTHKPKARRDFVCPISGAVYSSGDMETKARLEEGKLYNGWQQMRDKLAELDARDPPPPPKKRGSDRPARDRSRSRERPSPRDRDDRRREDSRRDDSRRRDDRDRHDNRRRDDRRRDRSGSRERRRY